MRRGVNILFDDFPHFGTLHPCFYPRPDLTLHVWLRLGSSYPHVPPAQHAGDRPRNLAAAFSDKLRVSRVVHGHERLFLIHQTSVVLVAP